MNLSFSVLLSLEELHSELVLYIPFLVVKESLINSSARLYELGVQQLCFFSSNLWVTQSSWYSLRTPLPLMTEGKQPTFPFRQKMTFSLLLHVVKKGKTGVRIAGCNCYVSQCFFWIDLDIKRKVWKCFFNYKQALFGPFCKTYSLKTWNGSKIHSPNCFSSFWMWGLVS